MFAWRPGRRFASPSGPWRQRRARRCWIAWTNIGTRRHMSAQRLLAWTQAQVQLHHLGVNPGEAGLFQRLASHVIFAGRDLRPSSDVIRQGSGPQSGLWSQGVSGDLPIVLLRIAEIEDTPCRPPGSASSRILADEATCRRPRHSERAQIVICAGPSGGDRNVGARQSVAARSRNRSSAWPGIRPSGGPDRPRHAIPACLDRPRCARGSTRKPFRSA